MKHRYQMIRASVRMSMAGAGFTWWTFRDCCIQHDRRYWESYIP